MKNAMVFFLTLGLLPCLGPSHVFGTEPNPQASAPAQNWAVTINCYGVTSAEAGREAVHLDGGMSSVDQGFDSHRTFELILKKGPTTVRFSSPNESVRLMTTVKPGRGKWNMDLQRKGAVSEDLVLRSNSNLGIELRGNNRLTSEFSATLNYLSNADEVLRTTVNCKTTKD
jgi:hypothetical protein